MRGNVQGVGDGMHYLNLQEGKRRAGILARLTDRRMAGFSFLYEGSKTEQLWVRTRKLCSCAMCGNPRRHFKGKDRLTLADKRQNDAARDALQCIRDR